jgi:lipopolysaccharide transport system permease protein
MNREVVHTEPGLEDAGDRDDEGRPPGSDGAAEWTIIGPREVGVRRRVAEIWTYRALVRYLSRKLIEKVTIRSKLGVLWIPLRPVLNVLSRALVFGGILSAPSGGIPYLVFFLTGMAVWSIFDRSLYWSVRSIELNARLLQRLYFPRLLMPISAFVPALLDFLIYVAMLVLMLAFYLVFDGKLWIDVGPQLALVPLGLALVLVLSLGLAAFLSVLGTYTRDIRYGISYALGFWVFLTPIIYPLSTIPDRFKWLASLNPMTAPVEIVREGLYGIGEITLVAVVSTVAVGLVTCVTGLVFFHRWEAAAVDTL